MPKDSAAGAQRFVFNPMQRILDHEIEEARKRTKTRKRGVRLKILKMRQGGSSTYCTARVQRACESHYGHGGMSIADKDDLPAQWLRRARWWWGLNPPQYQPKTGATNANEMYYSGLKSRYWIGSARGQTPGMGYTVHTLHCSELADWPAPIKTLADVLPAVPKSNPDVLLMLEGTGEMEGDWWYECWWASQRGQDEWRALFMPWFILPEYAMETDLRAEDYTEAERDLVRMAAHWVRDNPEWAAIAGFEAIRPEQVEFRRWMIRNEFGGDEDYFRCKYPARPEEAFLSIGKHAIPPHIVRHHESMLTEPTYYRLDWTDATKKAVNAVEVEPNAGLTWRVWRRPHDTELYTVGGDPAEGELSDKTDERSERDYSGAAVLARRAQWVVATFQHRPNADVFGEELRKAAVWYNQAWIGLEVNNAGWATLTEIKDYPRIVGRDGPVDSTAYHDLNRLGFKTTPGNRNQLIDSWIAACRADARGSFDHQIEVYCDRLVSEERSFVLDKNGKRQHRPGAHDDVLFAAMLANKAHLLAPLPSAKRTRRPPPAGVRVRPSYAYAGGTDTRD